MSVQILFPLRRTHAGPGSLARARSFSACLIALRPPLLAVLLAAQLFYALEVKEQQLEQAMQDKESLEQEVLTARQLSARGGGGDPKFIEIHHHNDISDDEVSTRPPTASRPPVRCAKCARLGCTTPPLSSRHPPLTARFAPRCLCRTTRELQRRRPSRRQLRPPRESERLECLGGVVR